MGSPLKLEGKLQYFSQSKFSKSIPSITKLKTPSIRTIENVAEGIRIEWANVSDTCNYRVYRRAAGEKYWTYLKTVKTTYYPDLDVDPGVDYIYTVRAVSGNVMSAFDTNGLVIKR